MSNSLVIPLKLCILSGILYGTFSISPLISDIIWPPSKTKKRNPNNNPDAVFIVLSLIAVYPLFSVDIKNLIQNKE